MKIWLDDQIDNPEYPDRQTPAGWVGVKTALQACRLLRTGKVSHVSFDHDLGEGTNGPLMSGYIVAKFIEYGAYRHSRGMKYGIPYLSWDVHSSNPVGRENIKRSMLHAQRLWMF